MTLLLSTEDDQQVTEREKREIDFFMRMPQEVRTSLIFIIL